ncbi:MAG TPA: alpha/beta hydrolase [Candidatus Udaeobacter sp.]|nr:alpha/beta hydrolase [Candidatus Udaeobacter sp.]
MIQATPTMKATRRPIALQKHCVRQVPKEYSYFAEALGVRARPGAALAILLLAIATRVCAEELPRKSKSPREKYPNVDVIYDSVTAPDGKRLRTIITKPHGAKEKLPVIFVAGWLSCDSVEAPADTKDESGLVFRGLAQLPEFALFRVDKQGVGDSEGVCSDTDFESELSGYRAAFRALNRYDFIDLRRVYILGISNGGGFTPLIPQSDAEHAQVRGYISIGGWVKTWFEHMLEIERRRFALSGKSPGEVNDRMRGTASLYHEWLIKGRPVDDILKEQPQLAELWPEGKDHAHLYGRPLAFYQQLQKLNLGAAWSRVKAPTYVLRGVFDWIMSREDSELIAAYVNRNGDLASFYEIPNTGHTFQHYLSLADAFKGKQAPFDPKVIGLLADWLRNKAITHED